MRSCNLFYFKKSEMKKLSNINIIIPQNDTFTFTNTPIKITGVNDLISNGINPLVALTAVILTITASGVVYNVGEVYTIKVPLYYNNQFTTLLINYTLTTNDIITGTNNLNVAVLIQNLYEFIAQLRTTYKITDIYVSATTTTLTIYILKFAGLYLRYFGLTKADTTTAYNLLGNSTLSKRLYSASVIQYFTNGTSIVPTQKLVFLDNVYKTVSYIYQMLNETGQKTVELYLKIVPQNVDFTTIDPYIFPNSTQATSQVYIIDPNTLIANIATILGNIKTGFNLYLASGKYGNVNYQIVGDKANQNLNFLNNSLLGINSENISVFGDMDTIKDYPNFKNLFYYDLDNIKTFGIGNIVYAIINQIVNEYSDISNQNDYYKNITQLITKAQATQSYTTNYFVPVTGITGITPVGGLNNVARFANTNGFNLLNIVQYNEVFFYTGVTLSNQLRIVNIFRNIANYVLNLTFNYIRGSSPIFQNPIYGNNVTDVLDYATIVNITNYFNTKLILLFANIIKDINNFVTLNIDPVMTVVQGKYQIVFNIQIGNNIFIDTFKINS
ncbi:MAG: hypothetical protein ORN58_00185 [Sediminibacterium sp.]|nr:hypothetical protein [Sediminibacterium sp.]